MESYTLYTWLCPAPSNPGVRFQRIHLCYYRYQSFACSHCYIILSYVNSLSFNHVLLLMRIWSFHFGIVQRINKTKCDVVAGLQHVWIFNSSGYCSESLWVANTVGERAWFWVCFGGKTAYSPDSQKMNKRAQGLTPGVCSWATAR